MKTPFLLVITTLLAGAPLSPVSAQDQAASPAKPAADEQTAREKEFEQKLTNATFRGRWCSVKEGRLGPEREEKYSLLGVRKVGGDVWVIQSRIQYGDKDVTVPVPVHVKWAGDTPVISITDLAIPGVGTYTARVLVHGNTYAGTWSGGEHGGLLSGVIERSQP
jgi:hypothetical protein